jgi:uncharacterized protein (TIGR03437 family)
VRINGRDAPILAVANVGGAEQVNLQVPFETLGNTAVVVVVRDGVESAPVEVPLLPVQPGIFTAGGIAVIVHSSNNTLVTPANPAEAGEYLYFYVNGLGSVTNTPVTGTGGPSQPLAFAQAAVSVTLDGVPCEVLYAGLAPGLAGVFQVNIRVPPGVSGASGDLVVRGGILSSEPAQVPIRSSVAALGVAIR